MTLTTSVSGLHDLASGSLPSLGGDPLEPSWSRSLQELMAANQALVGNVGAAPPQPTAAAQSLLGTTRTDFGSLTASLEAAKPASPKTAILGNVEETCRKHRDGIIERILKKEREQTHRTLERAIERQLDDDWAKEREWWMKEIVGTRNLVDSTNTLVPAFSQSSEFPSLPGTVSSNLLPGHPSISRQQLDPKLAENHVRFVRTFAQSVDLVEILSRFHHMASTSGSSAGYATAWQLFGKMLPTLNSPIDGASGALVHFCVQYQTFIKNRVASARLAGQDLATIHNYGSGMAGTIAAYVKLDHGSNASIWHILYYCLRCGDASAASDVLDVGAMAQEQFPEYGLIRNVIQDLSKLQGNASCIWETGYPVVSSRDCAAVVDLYEKARNLEPEHTHKIGVLALLSGQELASFNTIEDYLFGRLWRALRSENPREQIEMIGASIRKYGPEYFGGIEENGGWGYALPLLASQQFKTALTFLAEAGGPTGLLQATHLSLILSMRGVAVEDVGRSSSTGDLVAPILVKYSNAIESVASLGIAAALEYLLRIPKKEQALKQIASLVCRSSHCVDQLAGFLNGDGIRQPGELDKQLSEEEVSAVLTQSAESLRRDMQDRSKAEFAAKLFMLAGQYSSVVALLNELIVPVDQDDDDKRYWWQNTQQFYDHYLSKRSLALESLERENNLHLVSTNRMLMELRRFFSAVRAERYQEAFEMVQRLDLLPFAQGQVSEKEISYKNLDPILKRQFPALLTGAIQCLHGMYRKIKSEARGVDKSVEFHLEDLQKKARFLYLFAGLINMPNATREDIARMRNNMI